MKPNEIADLPTQSEEVKTPEAIIPLDPNEIVEAIVRPNNSYGGLAAHSVVQIRRSELESIPHCLISRADAQREAAEAARVAGVARYEEIVRLTAQLEALKSGGR